MMKTLELKINRFDGGMVDNVRKAGAGQFALLSDAKGTAESLIQQRAWQAWTNAGEKITRFLYAKHTDGSYKLFGFGGDSGDKPKIFNSALAATAWTAVQTAVTGARALNVFFRYKNNSVNGGASLFFWQNGTKLSSMLESSAVITESEQSLSYTNVAQPVWHSADDIAYFFRDNIVDRLNNSTFTSAVLTLPANMKIVGGAEYGIYLAILCTSIQAGEVDTTLFIWDRDSSLTTITDKIDLGSAPGVYIQSDENKGLWIVQDGTRNSALFADENCVIVRHVSSGGIRTVKIFKEDRPSYFSSFAFESTSNAEVWNGDLYFPLDTTTRKDLVARFSLVRVRRDNLSYTLDRDLDSSNATLINGVFQLQGSWYFAHSNSTTLSQGNLPTNTATYESPIFSSGDQTGKLLSVAVTAESMPNGGSVAIAYRKDEETAWTTIFTNTTLNSLFHEAINIESTGVTLPEFTEMQLELQFTGLCVITELHAKWTPKPDRLT